MGEDTHTFCASDHHDAKTLRDSSANSASQITPRVYRCKRCKITKRNCKKIAARFILLINGKT